MDALALATTSTATASASSFLFPSTHGRGVRSGRRDLGFSRRNKFVVLAAKENEEPKLDEFDQMELAFGRLIREDPKLTMAKIMARKVDPGVSYVEVEKLFRKNKGKMPEIEEVPFDVPEEKKPSSNSLDGLNLVRPVPKEGFEFQVENKPFLREIKSPKKPKQPVAKSVDSRTRSSVPNVILRKPTVFQDDDVEDRPLQSGITYKTNLTLKMRNDRSNEKFSDMTLLRKPKAMSVEKNEEPLGNIEGKASSSTEGSRKQEEENGQGKYSGFTLLNKPEPLKNDSGRTLEDGSGSVRTEDVLENKSIRGMQPLKKRNIGSIVEKTAKNEQSDIDILISTVASSTKASLLGKPNRLEKSVKETSKVSIEEVAPVGPGSYRDANEPKNTASSPVEDADWTRAEELLKTGNREEVELISCSMRGFVVSLGSLVGFLPYRKLATKWKFLAFETWLRLKGLDPSKYREGLGIISGYDVSDKDIASDSQIDQKGEEEITPDMKLEDLLRIYDQQKLKFLSSFVGQKIKVNVIMVDRKLRKLVVSSRPKEKEELVEKKKNLMAKLQVGDIVKCCIKKFTYYGVFVEVEGVPALIHQTEISWDETLDPASYFKVGQIVEAKVHQLDFGLERIFLSLKEVMPDPLEEALESVVGGHSPLDGRLQAAEADVEWPDVESLVKELQQVEGIQSVSKGRYFLSPGLAPTFQVYMASMFDNQYKLLARSGNKVQEVIVEASLDEEELKSRIMSCTNRVQ